MKISKTVVDRLKITGGGKVMRRKVGHRHLTSNKRATNKRRAAEPIQVVGKLEKKIKKLLGV